MQCVQLSQHREAGAGTCKLDCFYIMTYLYFRCSASAVLRTRQMSAKALQPLVVASNVVDVVKTLLCKLPVTNQNVQHSHIHGVLLQVGLLGYCPELMYGVWEGTCFKI